MKKILIAIICICILGPVTVEAELLYSYENDSNPYRPVIRERLYHYNVKHQSVNFVYKKVRKIFPELKIVKYENNSMLGIYIEENGYAEIFDFLNKLDCEIKQVRIEVELIEIATNKLNEIGIKLDLEQKYKVAGAYSVLADSEIYAKMKLAKQSGIARIKANPSLVVKDGTKAIIKVGDKVPVAVDVGNKTNVKYRVDFINAGIKLEIMPRVISENFVNVIINPEISSIKGWKATAYGEYPIISTKEASTEVRVKSDQTFIIAGLKSDSVNNFVYEIPYLSDIPFIGNLFRFSVNENIETEVLICVKPSIL
jgi:type II secretory pathway component GspD/PulD (secretin)